VAFTDESWIGPKELDPHVLSGSQTKNRSVDSNTLKEIEKKVLLERLEACQWNVMKAARSLGLTRNGLYSKMKQFGIARSKND
jgi:transcriptional regulator of acetoin/glycerol metabolism